MEGRIVQHADIINNNDGSMTKVQSASLKTDPIEMNEERKRSASLKSGGLGSSLRPRNELDSTVDDPPSIVDCIHEVLIEDAQGLRVSPNTIYASRKVADYVGVRGRRESTTKDGT